MIKIFSITFLIFLDFLGSFDIIKDKVRLIVMIRKSSRVLYLKRTRDSESLEGYDSMKASLNKSFKEGLRFVD